MTAVSEIFIFKGMRLVVNLFCRIVLDVSRFFYAVLVFFWPCAVAAPTTGVRKRLWDSIFIPHFMSLVGLSHRLRLNTNNGLKMLVLNNLINKFIQRIFAAIKRKQYVLTMQNAV
jgi:hypothetical protein